MARKKSWSGDGWLLIDEKAHIIDLARVDPIPATLSQSFQLERGFRYFLLCRKDTDPASQWCE